jgi:hypothetical protein
MIGMSRFAADSSPKSPRFVEERREKPVKFVVTKKFDGLGQIFSERPVGVCGVVGLRHS